MAEAGGPYRVFEGSTVTLKSSATDDVPATLVYEWDLDGDNIFGETGAAAARGDEVGQSPLFSAVGLDGPATVTVALRVTDECNLSHSDAATVNILNADPTADADAASADEEGPAVTIDVLDGDADPAGGLDPLTTAETTSKQAAETTCSLADSWTMTSRTYRSLTTSTRQ